MTRETTELVISDGAKGLESALDRDLWGVPHQRCIFHKIKNLADHLVFNNLQLDQAETQEQAVRAAKRARKKAVLAEVGWMYEGQNAAEFESRARLFAMIWRGREPEAVANFWLHVHKTVAYLSVEMDASLHLLIRTTNLLERFHKEARRKQRDIGMFQSKQGCEPSGICSQRERPLNSERLFRIDHENSRKSRYTTSSPCCGASMLITVAPRSLSIMLHRDRRPHATDRTRECERGTALRVRSSCKLPVEVGLSLDVGRLQHIQHRFGLNAVFEPDDAGG